MRRVRGEWERGGWKGRCLHNGAHLALPNDGELAESGDEVVVFRFSALTLRRGRFNGLSILLEVLGHKERMIAR